MISELSIEYNKTRQFAITQEIIEVVSGANAQIGQTFGALSYILTG